ncbi:LOW QUALITY PROTEIN: pannexin-1-like [Neosynchiropus ocellatus]
MAIAHVATEYVFSDFLLKEPNQNRYRSARTELVVDKMVTCVAVGLPLLLISLAFAQEVSVGTQISCFAPSNFSWRQAAYVDSYCWANVHTHTLNLWLHKFFPYILLLVAVMMYTPALFWRFSAAPLLQSDLSFIMEELDRSYNRAVKLSKSMATNERCKSHTCLVHCGQKVPTTGDPCCSVSLRLPVVSSTDPTEGCFNYPLVEKFLMTKRCSRVLLLRYLLCRGLTLVTLICACVYLGYYLRLATQGDEFHCKLRVGLLESDPTVPEQVQCKLVAVGVFFLLSLVNLVVFIALVPVVFYASLRPLLFHGYARFLEAYLSLPTVSVMPMPDGHWDDLSLYLLFLEENVSELKSYKYIKCLQVLELLKRRGECAGEGFDAMGLLQTLGQVKMDTIDGKKPEGVKADERDGGCKSQSSGECRLEMRELSPLLTGNSESASTDGASLRQRPL